MKYKRDNRIHTFPWSTALFVVFTFLGCVVMLFLAVNLILLSWQLTDVHSSECEQCLTGKNQIHGWYTDSQSCGIKWFKQIFDVFQRCVVKNVTDCPTPIRNGFEYNDTFARKVTFPLAAAAFADDPQKCLTNVLDDTKLIRNIVIPCAGFAKCSGFSATSDKHRAIMIAYRGSITSFQTFVEFVDIGTKRQQLFPGGGKVGTYFHDVFWSLWLAGMRDDIQAAIARHPSYQIWITGHSLGAALAVLASQLLVVNEMTNGENIRLVTTGESIVGDHHFVTLHHQLVPYSYRVVRGKDIIPHLRGLVKYSLRRYEVWYDNDMGVGEPYRICSSSQDCQCSPSVPMFSMKGCHHFNYFNKDIYEWGRNGCVD